MRLEKELIEKLIEAQNDEARYYNKRHTSLTFNENDQIMLRLTNLKTKKLIKKLNVRFTKSFVIERIINSQSYKLKVSQNFKIHSIFHVRLLESYKKIN